MAKDKFSEQDYERLGREVGELLKAEYESLPRTGWRHFVGGVFSGLGGIVGATLGLAVLLWLLHSLGGLPVIGRYLNDVGQTIQTKSPK